MIATRRLAAILVADVVGYSRLMGEDEAGTALAVRESREAARPIVAGHGGRIIKTMGDGVLLEFPSVVAAVECAVAIQKLMAERNAGVRDDKRLLYRIGVHLGDVLIDGEDILGDGVNIAARLEGIAEPGGVCLSGSAYEHVRGRIEAEFVDLGEKALKNIDRAIRAYGVRNGSGAPASAPSSGDPQKSGPPRLSIVVLPFANLGGDPEQDYFVDGVTESLTTDLSRIRGAVVIARNTAFTYKGKPFDVRQIGRDLNVRYVLEGSVQRGGNRMRVNVQLIEAETGNHLWAERFDKPVADLFDMQDEIVARLARQLDTALIQAEARRSAQSPQPDSMDLYFQGMARAHKGATPDNLAQARSFFERALSVDPGNVDALVGAATMNVLRAGIYASDDRLMLLTEAEATLAKALSLAPNNALAHVWMGAAKIYNHRPSHGVFEFERALALDRNSANAHGYLALAKIILGRPEETETHVSEALRLSPNDLRAFAWMHYAGTAKFHLGDDDEAVTFFRRALEINPNNSITYFYYAAVLALGDRLDEAKTAIQMGLSLNPTFTISRFRAGASGDNPVYLAQRERVDDGMRKAGVPEG
ncbi:MAG TPA: tetratricopeptide repeat protein [Roseiarcus sp.]|nr:tetratricopeptide repeat protein [Roseiarcus sp.]